MKLFLCAEAKNEESIEKLKAFDTNISEKNCLYIPTASNGGFYGSWKGGDSIKVARSLFKNLTIFELEDYFLVDVDKLCENIDVVWMAGGMSGYLLYWLRRIQFDKKLTRLLNNDILYIGSSAGSMICSKTQNSSEWFIGEEEPGASLLPVLGYIDFEIYPHYEEDLFSKIEEKWKVGDGQLYLLKNGEVIVVEDGSIKVLGESRIIEK